MKSQYSNVNEEILEHCRANLINYYVCYGSAVVSVRNAERKFISIQRSS